MKENSTDRRSSKHEYFQVFAGTLRRRQTPLSVSINPRDNSLDLHVDDGPPPVSWTSFMIEQHKQLFSVDLPGTVDLSHCRTDQNRTMVTSSDLVGGPLQHTSPFCSEVSYFSRTRYKASVFRLLPMRRAGGTHCAFSAITAKVCAPR